MSIPFSIVPRTEDLSEVDWFFKTRKYISKYGLYDAYKTIYNVEPEGIPTINEMVEALADDENRDIKVTLKIVSHEFDKIFIEEYLKVEPIRNLGIALAIEFRMLAQIINLAEDSDIFLYLTEYTLNEEELSLVIQSGIMEDLSKRIIDKSQVMYTTLVDNFEKLLKIDDCGVIDCNFISRYIEHSNFYNENIFLKYILESYTDVHPLFKNLYYLKWDPFTKSRSYSHWLRVVARMNEISSYYLEISQTTENIDDNKYYISEFIKFRNIFSDTY